MKRNDAGYTQKCDKAMTQHGGASEAVEVENEARMKHRLWIGERPRLESTIPGRPRRVESQNDRANGETLRLVGLTNTRSVAGAKGVRARVR